MQLALGVASMLVMLILAACAVCWGLALLRVCAASLDVPRPLAQFARQTLTSLQMEPGLPLLPWRLRRPVPWALVDLAGMIVLFFLGAFAAQYAIVLLGWLPAAPAEDKLSLEGKGLLVWADSGIKLALLAVALPLIALRTGSNWFDFGLSRQRLWSNLKLGLIGFVMLAPPVYAIQGALVYFWKPSKHPLMEMFKASPDAGFFAVLVVAATIVAPIFEELIFRVFLQGFLEKVFSHRHSPLDLVIGSSPQSLEPGLAVESPVELPDASSLHEVLYIADVPLPDHNPFTPPAVLAEPIVLAELAEQGQQPELRGPAAWLPIVISSVIFALLHYSHGPDWVALTLLAAGMGYLYQRTHSVVPSLIVHALLNGLSMFGLWIQVYGMPEVRG